MAVTMADLTVSIFVMLGYSFFELW